MAVNSGQSAGLTWLMFALITVAAWGLYGILLHKGQVQMADPVNGRYKAFLFVGIAYFLTAVLAPLVVLLLSNTDWKFSSGGMWWSLLAGIAGAVGAFCVLLAFGAAPKPTLRYVPVIMSIIFAGAPVVNAAVATSIAGTWGTIRWQFVLGILMAAMGGYMVTLFRPT